VLEGGALEGVGLGGGALEGGVLEVGSWRLEVGRLRLAGWRLEVRWRGIGEFGGGTEESVGELAGELVGVLAGEDWRLQVIEERGPFQYLQYSTNAVQRHKNICRVSGPVTYCCTLVYRALNGRGILHSLTFIDTYE